MGPALARLESWLEEILLPPLLGGSIGFFTGMVLLGILAYVTDGHYAAFWTTRDFAPLIAIYGGFYGLLAGVTIGLIVDVVSLVKYLRHHSRGASLPRRTAIPLD
jgi:hypothetical protein